MSVISDYVRTYARAKNISCAGIERKMGWTKDTIRKMKSTPLYFSRIRELAFVYTDLYDVVPGLRDIIRNENSNDLRDDRIRDLEKIVAMQDKLIKSLEAQIEMMKK